MGVVGRLARWDRGADAENKEQNDVGRSASELDGSTTEPVGKAPRARVGNELKTRIDQIEQESTIVLDPGF